jgi:hypothetical protein
MKTIVQQTPVHDVEQALALPEFSSVYHVDDT